jgi:hypothetical protein
VRRDELGHGDTTDRTIMKPKSGWKSFGARIAHLQSRQLRQEGETPMKAGIAEATCIAVVMGASMSVFAQTTERPGPPAASQPLAAEAQQSTAISPAQAPVTYVGCVQREADYRRAQHAGRGGVAGTGAGLGNEFVLVGATTMTAGATALALGAPPAEPGTAASGGMAGGAYELTGPAESQVEQYVGRRVEIVGTMKSRPTPVSDKAPAITVTVPESTTGKPGVSNTAIASPSGRPTPPAGGVHLTGQNLHLGELEVASVREAAGSCTPGQN